ncbi:MAG: DUF3486 family protein [Spirochaetales bacterium]|nr:DUF3486 family protein [Spirochaetales bacterium]MBR4426843.1 DUF3486 family protein [Spirochaetales bacterium]
MGRPSSIDLLPSELKERLLNLLNKPDVTQQEVADMINELAGEKVVSKSAVNRYAQKMEDFRRKNREAREVAMMLKDEMDGSDGNVLGKVAIEQARIIIFELFTAIDEVKKTPDDPKKISSLANSINKLVRAIKELEQASEVNMKLEDKIRARAVAAAEDVEKTVKAEGLSEKTVELIKSRILGIV